MMKTFGERFEQKMTGNIEPLTLMALIGGGAAAGRGLQGFFGARGAQKAAETQAGATGDAMQLLQQFYGQAQGAQQPYLQAGQQGLGQLTDLITSGGFQTEVPEFEYDPFEFEADPGYQFRLEQGLQGVERGAAARGGALGGGTLKALTEYGQGIGSQEYGKAHRRYTGERQFDYGLLSDLYGRQVQQQGIRSQGLFGLAGIGQQAAGQTGQLATGLGSGLAGLTQQRGGFQAAGQAAPYRALGDFVGGTTGDLMGLGSLYAMGAFGGGGGPQFNKLPANAGGLPAPMANQGLLIG